MVLCLVDGGVIHLGKNFVAQHRFLIPAVLISHTHFLVQLFRAVLLINIISTADLSEEKKAKKMKMWEYTTMEPPTTFPWKFICHKKDFVVMKVHFHLLCTAVD